MEKNQTDPKGQRTDNKSNTTQDGNKKETNPNNPVANRIPEQGSQKGNPQRNDSSSPQGKANTNVDDRELGEEESNDEFEPTKGKGDSGSRM